jgi:hypothetical protein
MEIAHKLTTFADTMTDRQIEEIIYYLQNIRALKGKIGGNDTDYAEFEADGTLRFNGSATTFDDMLFEIKTEPSYIYASSGGLGALADAATSTGSYLDTRIRNGIYWKIEEDTGSDDYFIATANPLVFNNIEQIPSLFWSGIYVGTDAHASNMSWAVYNNATTAWDNLTGTFTNNVNAVAAVVTGFTANHINTSKQVKVVLKHTSTGSASHYMWLDEVYLAQDNVPKRTYYKGGYLEVFRNTGYDITHGRVQFRHPYKVASDFYWHVHFINHSATIADGETVIFTLTKTFSAIYGIFPTATTLTATFTNNAAWRATLTAAQATAILTGTTVKIDTHLIAAGVSAISGTTLNISAIGLLEVKRSVGTHVSDVGILYSDFHIEQDTVGSRQEFSK